MARTLAQIQSAIIASVAANSNLTYQDADNITRNITYNTSKRAIWLAWTWIWAAAIAVEEQLQDVFISNVEAQVAQSAAATNLWIQGKMFAFQYDDTGENPQIVQLINTVPQYPSVIPSMQIITACAVFVDVTNTVNVLIAKGNPLQALTTPEAAAAQSYINYIGVAGITYNVQSYSPDRLYVDATIYFNGMYSTVINTNVINAINNYLQNLSITNFDGALKMSDLEGLIRNVTGVNDVVMNNVTGRKATDTPPTPGPPIGVVGTFYIQSKTLVNQQYQPFAGYVISEDTAGCTLAQSLTFVAQ